MEIVIPEALAAAAESESSVSLREGLPQGFMDYMGVQYEEAQSQNLPDSLKQDAAEEKSVNNKAKLRSLLREKFRKDAKKRIMEIAKTACEMLDASCDEMGKRYLSERQPPALTTDEVELTSKGDITADQNPILPNTMCRLVRPGIARLVVEDDKAVIYHCSDNSREYHENPISPMEFEMDDGPALEQLLTTVEPNWIYVNDLFHDTIEDKIQITQALYDEGIIAMKQQSEHITE
jgi:lysine-specific demethylase/histidyl-hydroxylase NO66